MKTYSIFYFENGKGWIYTGYTVKAKDTYKAEAIARNKYNLAGILLAMSESMLLLNDCIPGGR